MSSGCVVGVLRSAPTASVVPICRGTVVPYSSNSAVQTIEEQCRDPDASWHQALHARAAITPKDWNEVVTHRPSPKIDILQLAPRILEAPDPTLGGPSGTYWLYTFMLQPPPGQNGGLRAAAAVLPELPALGIVVKRKLPELEPFEVFLEGQPGQAAPGSATLTCVAALELSAGAISGAWLPQGAQLSSWPAHLASVGGPLDVDL